jgi:hypothetical protein
VTLGLFCRLRCVSDKGKTLVLCLAVATQGKSRALKQRGRRRVPGSQLASGSPSPQSQGSSTLQQSRVSGSAATGCLLAAHCSTRPTFPWFSHCWCLPTFARPSRWGMPSPVASPPPHAAAPQNTQEYREYHPVEALPKSLNHTQTPKSPYFQATCRLTPIATRTAVPPLSESHLRRLPVGRPRITVCAAHRRNTRQHKTALSCAVTAVTALLELWTPGRSQKAPGI